MPELVERARSYRAMCQKPRASRPRTFEELLNYGVLLHNRGEYTLAVKYLGQALSLQPSDEGALYCLAAAQARAGDATAALRALRAAIHANPATRSQARHDADFALLRGHGEFCRCWRLGCPEEERGREPAGADRAAAGRRGSGRGPGDDTRWP